MAAAAFADLVSEIRQELATATEALLGVHEAGLDDIARFRDGDDAALCRLEGRLLGLLELCAFEDLIGQRLTQLSGAISPASLPASGVVKLENGPALRGQGLAQADIDDLLSTHDPRAVSD